MSGIRWERSFPRGFWDEGVALRCLIRPMPARFFVFAQGRSGSTLLTTLLDSHPMICCEGELLELPRIAPRLFVENRARRSRAPNFGFHVKPYQLTKRQRVGDIGEFLAEMHERGWRIVWLRRRNTVRQAISAIVARKTGRYHFRSETGEGRPERIRLDVREVIGKAGERAQWLERERAALEGLDHVALTYEEDLFCSSTRHLALARVLDHLRIPRMTLSTDLKRAVNRPLAEIIENYDELREALCESRLPEDLIAERSAAGRRP